ncbi:MAG TPA: hypothetical protein VK661_02765 [Planctomycetota bacterium]|nr:hypothetical protein [Planctomycetota bacterium]
MVYIRFLLALAAWTCAGAGLVAAFRSRSRPVWRLQFLALSYILGFGAVGLASVLVMMCGIHLGPWLPVAMAAIGVGLYFRFRPVWDASRDTLSRVLPGYVVAGGAAVLVFLAAISSDHLQGDGAEFWGLKARSIERAGTFRNPDFTSEVRPHRHAGYPLLLPSTYAWIYSATGSYSERPIRISLAIFFLASLAVVSAELRERLPGPLASWMTALYAWIPAFTRPATGIADGYCDYPLAIFILIGLIQARRWLERPEIGSAILSAVALACAGQSKDEGAAFAVLALVLFPIFGAAARGPVGALRAAAIPAVGLPALALWFWIRQSFVPDPELLTAATGFDALRIPGVVYWLGWNLAKVQKWSLMWPAVLALLILRFPRPKNHESLLAWGGLGILAMYVGVWTLMPAQGARAAMEGNAVRLILHSVPLLFVWSARMLGATRARNVELNPSACNPFSRTS